MRSAWRVAGHLLLVVAAIVGVLAATAELDYPPLRRALVIVVAVVCAVSLFGRFPSVLGPVAGSVPARMVRIAGTGLAGLGTVGVVLGFGQGGDPAERASAGVPIYAVVLAIYFVAFLAATRRESGLGPRAIVTGAALGLLAAALFAVAVAVLPPGVVPVAYLLVVGAAVGAGWLAGPADGRLLAGLLAIVTACEAVFFVAVVLFRYGPAAWAPYAGAGPLTPAAQVGQNRAEAVDPYVGLLVVGALVAVTLVGGVLTFRFRSQAEVASTAVAA